MVAWVNGAQDARAKVQANATKVDTNISTAKKRTEQKKEKKKAVWSKKVARYLAYCVDGGLL